MVLVLVNCNNPYQMFNYSFCAIYVTFTNNMLNIVLICYALPQKLLKINGSMMFHVCVWCHKESISLVVLCVPEKIMYTFILAQVQAIIALWCLVT